jgi:hypothetical protein
MPSFSLEHSWEILRCLVADQDALRAQLKNISRRGLSFEERREQFKVFPAAFTAHIRAEEEILLSRALELEDTRVIAMWALEEHEIAELMIDRARHSVQAEQLEARLQVLSDLVIQHAERSESELYPLLRARLSVAEREEMGMRYREVKDRSGLVPVFQELKAESLSESQTGRVGYVIAWLLGVPFWVLLLVFLVRGH